MGDPVIREFKDKYQGTDGQEKNKVNPRAQLRGNTTGAREIPGARRVATSLKRRRGIPAGYFASVILRIAENG
jgi:hypothetical protein